jgi:hypothetical protein
MPGRKVFMDVFPGVLFAQGDDVRQDDFSKILLRLAVLKGLPCKF